MISEHAGDLRGTHASRVPAKGGIVGRQDGDCGPAVHITEDAGVGQCLQESTSAQETKRLRHDSRFGEDAVTLC